MESTINYQLELKMEMEWYSRISLILCSINGVLGIISFVFLLARPLNVNSNVSHFLMINVVLLTFLSIFYGFAIRMYLLIPIFGGACMGFLKDLHPELLNFATVVAFVIVLFNIILIEVEGRVYYLRICHKSDVCKREKALKLCAYIKLYLVLAFIAIYLDNAKNVGDDSLAYYKSQNPNMTAYLEEGDAKYLFYYTTQDSLLHSFLFLVVLTILTTIIITVFYSTRIIQTFIKSSSLDAKSEKYINRSLSFKLFAIRAFLSFILHALPILYFSFVLFLSIKEGETELKIHRTIQIATIMMHIYPTLLFLYFLVIHLLKNKIDIRKHSQQANDIHSAIGQSNYSINIGN
uniref:G_PROTEIN_RECEP_F1_2 domain-containing protein n=1 Tax=Strongyloides venezuelensis TaxID=75913 RepID=A0A0K0FVE0_STRVS